MLAALLALVLVQAGPAEVRIDVQAGGSIGAAVREAAGPLGEGTPVRIVVEAGVYREAIGDVTFDGAAAATPLTIEGDGGVVLSGSDVVTDWENLGGGLFAADWPHDWGNWAYPWETPGVLGHRAELVFVDGEPLRQVLIEPFDYAVDGELMDHGNRGQVWTPRPALPPGVLAAWTFGVSEADDRLYVRLPAGTDIAGHTVEVAVRPQAMRLTSKDALTLRRLTFTHFASRTRGHGAEGTVALLGTPRGVTIDGCRFVWNGAHGLDLRAADVTITDSVFTHNGFSGIAGGFDGARLVGNVTSHNNWRGAMGGQRGWWLAGIKLQRSTGVTIEDHEAVGNLAPGVWFDIQNRDVAVSDLLAVGNDGAGLFLELSPGPFVVEGVRSSNDGPGLLVSIVGDLVVRDSVLHTRGTGTDPLKDEQTGVPALRWQCYLREDEHATAGDPIVPERFGLTGTTLIAGPGGVFMVENVGVPRGEAHATAAAAYEGRGNTFVGRGGFAWVAADWSVRRGGLAAWAAHTREADAISTDAAGVPAATPEAAAESARLRAWVQGSRYGD